jgi:hypothetical protein
MSEKRFYDRLIAFIVAVAMIVAIIPLQVVSVFADDTPNGSGTTDDPYQIGTAEELYWFAQKVNSGDTSINAILTADITVNSNVLNENYALNDGSFTNWTPIGKSGSSGNYNGTFDGKGHTISGLYYKGTTSYTGLFYYIGSDAVIKNVGIEDFYFEDMDYVGGICAYNYGTITDCYVKGNVSGFRNVGGICGTNDRGGKITNCYTTGSVSGDTCVGGICGSNYYISDNGGSITNCYTTASVSGSSYVGGICGQNKENANITNCYATGNVSGDGYVGGICGVNVGEITDCYAVVSVSVTGNGVFGFITGKNYGTVKNVYCPTSDTYNAVGENVEEQGIDCSVSISLDAFASGEVCYLLNEESSENVTWYQTLGENGDTYPVLNSEHGVVYLVDGSYINPCTHTNYTNGICTGCGKVYQEPGTTKVGSKTYYEIANAGNLYWFAEEVNSGSTSINGILTADITVNEKVLEADGSLVDNASSTLRAWTPIGDSSSNRYAGIFDGQRHTISGLYLDDSTTEIIGLFGYSNYGTIKNIGVKDFYFNGGYNRSYVGAICGSNNGTISNSYAIGSINSSYYAGGICGANTYCVNDCYANVNVTGGSTAGSRFGGISGTNSSKVYNCYTTGKIENSDKNSFVGAICGYNNNSNASYVYNNFYLDGIASKGMGGGTDTTTKVSKEELASGEVCYLLNGESEKDTVIWKQTIDIANGTYPTFTGDIVNRYTATGGNLYGNNKVVKYVDSTVTAVDFTTLDVTSVASGVFNDCTNKVVAYVADDSLVLGDKVIKKYVVSDLENGGVSLDTTGGADFKFAIVVNTIKFGGAVADGADFLEEVDVIDNEIGETKVTDYTESEDNENNIEFKVIFANPTEDSTIRGQVQVKKWNDDKTATLNDIIYYVTKAYTVDTDGNIKEANQ